MEHLYEFIHPISQLDQRELYLTGALALVAIAALTAFGVFAVYGIINMDAHRRGDRPTQKLSISQWVIVAALAIIPVVLVFTNPDAAWVMMGLHRGIGSGLVAAIVFTAALGMVTIGVYFAVKAATKRPQSAKQYAIVWLLVAALVGLLSVLDQGRRVFSDQTRNAGGDTDTLRFNIGGYVADDFDEADSLVLSSDKPFKLCFVNYLATPERTSDTLDADSVSVGKGCYYQYAARPIIPGLARVFYSTLPQEVGCRAWRNGKVEEDFGVYELGTYRPFGRFLQRYSPSRRDWEPLPYSLWRGDTVRVSSSQPFDYTLGTKEGHSDGAEVTLWRHERDADHRLLITPTSGAIAQPIYLRGARSAMYGIHLLLALLGYAFGWFLLGRLAFSFAVTPIDIILSFGNKPAPEPEPEPEQDMRDIQTEIVQVEERVTSLAARIDGALAPTSAWQHYKNLKHTRRAQENLAELTKVVRGMETVVSSAVTLSEAQNKLLEAQTKRADLEEITRLKAELEKVTLHANIAEQRARLRDIENPPKEQEKPRQESRTEREQREQRAREEEAARRRTVWEEEEQRLRTKGVTDPGDIAAYKERFYRENGWLQ